MLVDAECKKKEVKKQKPQPHISQKKKDKA